MSLDQDVSSLITKRGPHVLQILLADESIPVLIDDREGLKKKG